MLTAHGTPEHAFTAYRHGAVHFMSKPYKLDELKERVRYEFEAAELRREKATLEGVRLEFAGQPLLGDSAELKRVLAQITKIAKLSTSTVMIRGETGVGKELVAQQIHVQSPRGQGPFVELNCSAVPENLLESELFGFEKGAFTDAKRTKKGVFEMAGQGTLFLDEIGEMSLALQAKLLKVLESKTFRRLGGTVDITVDTRVVAATNRDLRRRSRTDASARTCTSGCRSFPSRYRRCARARATSRCSSALHRALLARGREDPGADPPRSRAPAHRLRVARQRARAAQRDRAHRAARERRRDPPRAPAGRDRAAAAVARQYGRRRGCRLGCGPRRDGSPRCGVLRSPWAPKCGLLPGS
jgi:hypothetical protein